MLLAVSVFVALAWLALLVEPMQRWRNREQLSALAPADHDLSDVAVLIPARDEAELVAGTLRALARQGRGLAVVLVDDQSADATVERARAAMPRGLEVVPGAPLPAGWTGKVWAQHQGLARVERPLTLLLDADIRLAPGMLAALVGKLREDRLELVSIMARLRVESFWERLLMPAFVYFFKLLYPFAASNAPHGRVAAAAGGCVLLDTARLRSVGGFAALRHEVIDDCALARLFKHAGARTWIGLSADVRSRRAYPRLGAVRDLVARTAYTQLGYSPARLAACTGTLALMFATPLAALAAGPAAAAAGAGALALMLASFAPSVLAMGLGLRWTLALPVAAALFLAMTWTSALRYARGERSRWRGRSYRREPAAAGGRSPS